MFTTWLTSILLDAPLSGKTILYCDNGLTVTQKGLFTYEITWKNIVVYEGTLDLVNARTFHAGTKWLLELKKAAEKCHQDKMHSHYKMLHTVTRTSFSPLSEEEDI